MKIGLVLQPFSDENLRLAAQLGAIEVVTGMPAGDYGELALLKSRVEDAGLRTSITTQDRGGAWVSSFDAARIGYDALTRLLAQDGLRLIGNPQHPAIRQPHLRLARNLCTYHDPDTLASEGEDPVYSAYPQRYLWTDAFAVCNYLGLADATGDDRYEHLAEIRQGRSDQDSSPCPTQPQSHAQTPAASRHMHRLPRWLGAGSSNRKRGRRRHRST